MIQTHLVTKWARPDRSQEAILLRARASNAEGQLPTTCENKRCTFRKQRHAYASCSFINALPSRESQGSSLQPSSVLTKRALAGTVTSGDARK